ncbi:MAG: histidinol-phosphate transaminase [Cyclobacteriaceae bacterium]
MTNSINRRQMLRAGALLAGSSSLLPHLAFGEMPPLRKISEGRINISPLYREYVARPSNAAVRARLNSNENKFGPSPQALKAISDQSPAGNLYGWQPIGKLRNMIAEREGVSEDHILIGPGSTDFLEKFGIALFMDGGNLVSADPTFMTLIRVSEAAGADWKNIPLTRSWSHDLPAMEKAVDDQTRLVYLCNPNNPTGTLTDFNEMLSFCERVSQKAPVFVDEAYMEFLKPGTGKSAVELVKKGSNVIIARTFSKLYGMAGLRIGYVVGQPETLEKVARLSFTGMGISNTSLAAAIASLGDEDYLGMCREKHDEIRKFTYDGLRNIGYDPVPSYTSFMIFPIRTAGRQFLNSMQDRGVQVRAVDIGGQPYCRVSLGRKDEMEIFLDNVAEADV